MLSLGGKGSECVWGGGGLSEFPLVLQAARQAEGGQRTSPPAPSAVGWSMDGGRQPTAVRCW